MMNVSSRPSMIPTETGWILGGRPSPRTVARRPFPVPDRSIRPRPADAIEGAAVARSFHVVIDGSCSVPPLSPVDAIRSAPRAGSVGEAVAAVDTERGAQNGQQDEADDDG